MKTATIPALRVEPELRRAAEEVLKDDESLSSFMETSLRASIAQRKLQREFIARGLAARDEARKTGQYHQASDVYAEIETCCMQRSGRETASDIPSPLQRRCPE